VSCGDRESGKGGGEGGAAAPAGAAVVPSAAAAARIVADPNPVPAGAGPGTTTITWDTGGGMNGQVYVAAGGGPEELFAENAKGSKKATWIGSGAPYEFRYAGTDRKKRLATVTVTREKSGQR
jgi:hypothetical protein